MVLELVDSFEAKRLLELANFYFQGAEASISQRRVEHSVFAGKIVGVIEFEITKQCEGGFNPRAEIRCCR